MKFIHKRNEIHIYVEKCEITLQSFEFFINGIEKQ